ncbi:MAG: hypothetical protein GWN84_20585 [Gammaproteobacteria bacterium]|nr:hypothetical protein [Gammaproteobacteria bacterium]NIR85159.1 hypothetical protein [Gammaproteobacteria bacterium]NIU06208.1 hypothetical protein [Gammaproteobacteria bacterium]NIX87481.1 hypothetical protein [Gammaproteobacteria bacterium]
MGFRPVELLHWADNPGGGDAGRVEPPEGLKDGGFNNGQRPPAGHHNWLFGVLADWARYNEATRLIDRWVLGQGTASTQALNGSGGGFNFQDKKDTFLLVGDATGSAGTLLVTDDGEVLTQVSNPKNFALYDVVRVTKQTPGGSDSQMFICVGAADGTDAYMIRTTDPFGTWTERTNPKNFDLYAIAEDGDGTIIAAGDYDGSNIYAIRSQDQGDNWTELGGIGTGLGAGAKINGIAWSPLLGMFALVGQDASGVPIIYTTVQGDTVWTRTVDAAATGALRAVAWNGKAFVAVADAGEIHRSVDGVTWTLVRDPSSAPDNFNIQDVAADPVTGAIIAPTSGYILYSGDDGQTWQFMPHPPAAAANNTSWHIAEFHKGFLLATVTGSDQIAARGGMVID